MPHDQEAEQSDEDKLLNLLKVMKENLDAGGKGITSESLREVGEDGGGAVDLIPVIAKSINDAGLTSEMIKRLQDLDKPKSMDELKEKIRIEQDQ
jgi:hypothetical protein